MNPSFAPLSPPSDFDREETTILEQVGSFLTPVGNSRRTVSVASFSPPYSNETPQSSSSPSTTASVRLRGFPSSPSIGNPGSSTILPIATVSPAALQFIGFNETVANEIYSRYISRSDPAQSPDSLLDYVNSFIRSRDPREEMDPVQAMRRMGLMQRLQNAILNPRYADIFGTESLHFWIKDSLRINYQTLIMLHDRLKKIASRTRAHKTTKSQGSPVGKSSQTPEFSATVMTAEELDESLPVAYIALEAAGPVLENHRVLWKARAACDMENWIRQDGSLGTSVVSTYGGGDFNHRNVAHYWIAEYETAEKYRGWAAQRCPWSETWMIRIQVSIPFVSGLRQTTLWYSPDWKEYVWYCKRKNRPPPRFDRYWQAGQAEMITGHICNGVTTKVTRIKQENVQNELNEDFVLKLSSGTKATQVVFMQDSSVERLGTEIRGKIHIDITAPMEIQSKP